MSFRKLASLTTLSLVGILLTGFGCSSGNSSPSGTANIRTVNALVGTTTSVINFAQGTSTTTPFTSNVGYGTVDNAGTTGGYVSVNAGLGDNFYALTTSSTNNLITSAAYNIAANTNYTLIAFGDYQASASSGATPTLIPYQDTLPSTATLSSTTPPSAAIRIIHVAPITTSPNVTAGYQTVDIYNNGVAVSGLTGIAYGSASTYVTVPAGTFNFTLHTHTTHTAIPLASQTNLSSQSLGAGHAYTLIFIGTDDNGGTAPTPASLDPFDIKVLSDE